MELVERVAKRRSKAVKPRAAASRRSACASGISPLSQNGYGVPGLVLVLAVALVLVLVPVLALAVIRIVVVVIVMGAAL